MCKGLAVLGLSVTTQLPKGGGRSRARLFLHQHEKFLLPGNIWLLLRDHEKNGACNLLQINHKVKEKLQFYGSVTKGV